MPRLFDLEKAKAGKPLVTRDGRKATFIGVTEDPSIFDTYRVVAVVAGQRVPKFFSLNGRFSPQGTDSNIDLQMADPPMKTGWVVMLKHADSKNAAWPTSSIFVSKEEATKALYQYNSEIRYGVAKIEWTEEE